MTMALERGEGAASHPGRSLPRESPGTHFIRTGGWVGPRPGLDRCGKSHPTGFDPRTVQPVASRIKYVHEQIITGSYFFIPLVLQTEENR
jgi:hypothetical protein